MSATEVLLVGESWQTVELHVKGFDMFYRGDYTEGADHLRDALAAEGVGVEYMPCHEAASDFPETPDALGAYDVVVLSDIGYDTLAIPPSTFNDFERRPNRLELLDRYVRDGGGLLMIGGYMSFQGIKGEGGYRGSVLEETLPVSLDPFDDRVERSEGVVPDIVDPDHPITRGLPDEWPHFLGYNRVAPDDDATTLARVNGDPLLVVGDHGHGRAGAFTSDCAPHWGSPAFTDWGHYPTLWSNVVGWLADG